MKTFTVAKKRSSPGSLPRHVTAVSPADSHWHTARAAVSQILRGPRLQAKLTIGAPDDVYEREADQVADAVMRMPEELLHRQPLEEEEELLQAKPLSPETSLDLQRQIVPEEDEEELLRAKEVAGHTSEVKPSVAYEIASMQGGGRPLPAPERAYFEPRFGLDFSQVRIHTSSRAEDAARAVNARAFTVGRDVVFATGEYAPEATSGKKLLAHELTHVIQQSNAVEDKHIQKTPSSDPVRDNEDESISLEITTSGTHEIVIDGRPYDILFITNTESLETMHKSMRNTIRDHLGLYPNLSSGPYAFILEKSNGILCQEKGNCLGWAKGTFSFIDPSGKVWEKVPEYIDSIGLKVPRRHDPSEVYQKKVNSQKLPPHAIWDYFMNVEFNAVPAESEADANFALYGRGFNLSSEGPTHIAFRPRGGSFWLSKPSIVSFPVLHQNASQIAGGQMGEIILFYKREEGPVDHIHMRRMSASPD